MAKTNSPVKPPLFLIDSYAQIYRSYFAFMNRPLRNGNGENVSALFGFAKTLVSLMDGECTQYESSRIAAVFDSRTTTFRHKKYPLYKANREKAPQELHDQVPKVEAFLAALGVDLLRVDGFEADDIIATLACICRTEGRECYILSADKDLLQLVGDGIYVLRPSKTTSTPALDQIGVEEVKSSWGILPNQMLDFLALAGDAVDNIPGVKGIGEITAVKLLQRYGSLENVYENIDQISGAQGKKLSEGYKSALLSRELVRLVDNVPLGKEGPVDIDLFSPTLNRAKGAEYLLKEDIQSVARQLTAEDGELELGFSGKGAASKRSLKNGADSVPAPPMKFPSPELLGEGSYRVILDIGELEGYFALATSQGFMALDFETDSLVAWYANPVGISFALKPKEAFYVPVMRHGGEEDCLPPEEVRALLAPLLMDNEFTVIAHNAKFDYAVSRGWGLPRWKARIWDTMIAAWLCDSDRLGFSLDSLAFSYLGYSALTFDTVVPKGKTFADITLDIACRYSAEDADLCLRIYQLLGARLSSLEAMDLFKNIEMPLLPILVEMEGAGIKIQRSSLRKYGVELGAHLKKIEAETWQLVGHEFNISSPKQLQDVLFVERQLKPSKKTKTGWSTDVAVLEELAHEDRVPQLVLQHRSLAKLKSTYVDTLGGMADSKSRLHTTFVQTGTATGRLSSRDPNLQNIPVRDEAGRRIREAFIAGEGCLLVSADYNQIELVIFAHLSQDKNLVGAFSDGTDVHTRTAAHIFGIEPEAVDAAQRRMAKTINFGIMYGMSAFRLSAELGINRNEAQTFIDMYFKMYAGVQDYINRHIALAEKTGFVSTLFGRRRAVPTITSPNRTEKSAAERIAVNTPIQGSAADIVKKAMLDVDKALCAFEPAPGSVIPPRMLLQVHDELILECAEQDAPRLVEMVRTVMENAVTLSVPLRVSVETGKRWGDFH